MILDEKFTSNIKWIVAHVERDFNLQNCTLLCMACIINVIRNVPESGRNRNDVRCLHQDDSGTVLTTSSCRSHSCSTSQHVGPVKICVPLDRLVAVVCVLGPVSISDKTSYRKISWSLEAARLVFKIARSLWNLKGTSAAYMDYMDPGVHRPKKGC